MKGAMIITVIIVILIITKDVFLFQLEILMSSGLGSYVKLSGIAFCSSGLP